MSLPRQLFTPAFKNQHLGRSFAAIVGIMVFIATFAMAAEAVLLTASYLWGRSAETLLTIEIPSAGDEASVSQDDRTRQALSLLRAIPEVETATLLPDNDVERLLSPWFDKPELLSDIPLPALIDVARKPGATIDAAKIQTVLKPISNDIRINNHGDWTKDVWRLVRGLTLLGGLTIALTGLTLVIAVGLICRTIIATERETISLLHLMGAENVDIALHFQDLALRIASRAAFTGFLAALVLTGLLFFSTQNLANLSSLGWIHWIGVGIASLFVPLCAVVIATVTARISVMRLIETFP